MQAIRTSFVNLPRRAAAPSIRSFSVTLRNGKDATETVKETADAVNKKAGEAFLKGVIEPGEKAADAVYKAAGIAEQKGNQAAAEVKSQAAGAKSQAERAKAEGGENVLKQAASVEKKKGPY